MRAVKLFIAMVSVSIYLQSCTKEVKPITLTSDYMPLENGNYWQLDYSEKKEVVGTKTIENKTYYILQTVHDTTYYRIENDKIYVIEHNTDKESVKFDLSASVNDTWNFNSWAVKLVSKTDTIIINNRKIANCYQFFFDYPVMVDDEHSIWLAPGIGFIQEQCGECMYQIKKLNKARIRGLEIDY